MSNFVNRVFLLAQPSNLESMGSGFRGKRANFDAGDVVNVLLVVGCVALAIWTISYAVTFRERRWARSSPLMLFIDLCRAHGLRWSEAWLLWRVAASQRLADASRLFVEPERLETTNLRPSLRGHAKQLDGIRSRLFLDLTDEDEDDEPDDGLRGSVAQSEAIPADLSSWLLSDGDILAEKS